VQAALRAGEEITGASTFRIVRELDAGPVFGVVTEKVGPADTAGDLLARLARSGARLLVSTMDGIEDGSLRAVPQAADGLSYAPKLTVDDARVSFAEPAITVDRLVRAVTPEPGAWALFRDERLKLGPVSVVEEDGLAPGELKIERRRVLAGTATQAVQLGEVQAQGKKRMAAMDWARGTRIERGERLA
jgi:methionyl-tRNA formyltransferase